MNEKVKLILLASGLALVFIGAIFLPGSQFGQGRSLVDPANCGCHAGYDQVVEPMYNWHGSMMSQAARDPIFFSALDLANHDLADAGTFCLRCHTPRAHLEGRTEPPDGSALTAADIEGVFCDFCHALVDPLSLEGNTLVDPDVTSYGNAMWVVTEGAEKRGPYTDPEARHEFLYDPFQRSSEACASCHDVSNPLLCDPLDPYNVQKCLPEQRTYSEWANSWYATQGEAGNCQACHMPHVVDGKACKQAKNDRTFLPVHHLNGGNTWVPDAIAVLYAGDNSIDFDALAAGKQRAVDMLQDAASIEAFDMTDTGLGRMDVQITNLTGHKLPTGYPEGRRMWINVLGYDAQDLLVFSSGVYDAATALLINDSQIKIYEIHFGVEQPDGSCDFSFRLVQNNCIEKDNRIPPKGFTNAAFEAVGAGHTHYHYSDGQYWDDTPYVLPASVASVDINLYYQTTTKEYVEFLSSAVGSGQRGADLLATFNATGKAAPVLMETFTLVIDGDTDGMGDAWETANGFDPGDPTDAAGDLDGDSLTNLEEYLYGTLPGDTDTDNDQLNDYIEIYTYSTNPLLVDSDFDGLGDGDEVNFYGTTPTLWDTDGGGEPDGSEILGRNPVNDPDDDAEMAQYSATYTAPQCLSGKSPCIVPQSLIDGRDNITDGEEPNQPNTLAASTCADGTVGTYHNNDESIDAIVVTALGGGTFNSGDSVMVEADVYCWTDVGLDPMYVFHADSVSNPSWNLVGSTSCSVVGMETLSVTFNLGQNVGNQAIRTVFGYEAAASPCDPGDWTDRDDLVLYVSQGGPTDSDGDGMPDAWEDLYPCVDSFVGDSLGDPDSDGLDNNGEYSNNTSPCNRDTDADLIPDGYEVQNSLIPTVTDSVTADYDGDGNPNVHEYFNGTLAGDMGNPDPYCAPGGYCFGESGGLPTNGEIEGTDLTEIKNILKGSSSDFSGIIPPNGDTADLDGTGGIEGSDLTIYKQLLSGQWGGTLTGAATHMNPTLPSGSTVTGGATIEVEVLGSLTDTGSKPRSGYGVVFWIDSTSTGAGAIYGGDGSAESEGFPAGSRYDVTGTVVDGGKARVWLNVNTAGSIKVNVKVPLTTKSSNKYLLAVPESGNMQINLNASP